MASGTINGSFSGPSSTDHARPQITWSSTTSISGNSSSVTATLRFRKWQYWNSWNANGHSVTITINGNSDSAKRVFDLRNSGNYVVWSRTVTVNHDSDGSKTIKIGASGNTGVKLGTYNFSGDANLGTIPRASSLSSFSFNADLKNDTANRINYNVDRKSGGFRHQIQLRDGSTTVHQWDNISSNGDSTLTLTASEVNTLLNRMSSSTTKSYTLRIATRSGVDGGWIGSAVSRNATATVHGDVKPSASKMSVSISGSGHDNSIGKYVQGITKVYGSFSRSAGYGASVSSSSFVVRRVSGSADSQTVNSYSGTTGRAVALSGSYEAIGTVTDSRGRKDTSKTTFTVDAYSAPVITAFSATRDSGTPTKVNILRAGRHTPLDGSNALTVSVQRRRGSGAWSNVVSDATMWGSSFSSTVESTENNVSLSYDFRVYIKDQFNRDAEIVTTVSTQTVVLDIHKNEGIGIGKLHERGELDVAGEAFFRGKISLDADDSGSVLNLTGNTPTGHGYINYFGSDNVRKAYVGFGGVDSNWFRLVNESGGPVNIVGSEVRANGTSIVDSGSNKNGDWVRFYDGTMICRGYVVKTLTINQAWGGLYYANVGKLTFPEAFSRVPYVQFINSSANAVFIATTANNTSTTQTGNIDIYRPNIGASDTYSIGYVAIGRWK